MAVDGINKLNGRCRGKREESHEKAPDSVSLSVENERPTRDGTVEPVSRDQILMCERGQGKNKFSCCSADHESRMGNLTWFIHTLLKVLSTIEYRATSIKTYKYKAHTVRCNNEFKEESTVILFLTVLQKT